MSYHHSIWSGGLGAVAALSTSRAPSLKPRPPIGRVPVAPPPARTLAGRISNLQAAVATARPRLVPGSSKSVIATVRRPLLSSISNLQSAVIKTSGAASGRITGSGLIDRRPGTRPKIMTAPGPETPVEIPVPPGAVVKTPGGGGSSGGGGGGSYGGGGGSTSYGGGASDMELDEMEGGEALPDAIVDEPAATAAPAKKPLSTGAKVGLAAAAGLLLFSMFGGKP